MDMNRVIKKTSHGSISQARFSIAALVPHLNAGRYRPYPIINLDSSRDLIENRFLVRGYLGIEIIATFIIRHAVVIASFFIAI